MPQLNNRGKYVFGWCIIREDGSIQIPPETLKEYNLLADDRVIGISGSKTSGAFSISTKTMFKNSFLKKVLDSLEGLNNYNSKEGELLKYKNKYYFWLNISDKGVIKLPDMTLKGLDLKKGQKLLNIRGSDIAFDFASKGPLYEKGLSTHIEISIF